jgi:RNA polymerase sigma-70 factor (ECF subfamily)
VEQSTNWLEDFHAGRKTTLEECYRTHFARVRAAIGRLASGADAETIAHEVFYRLLSDVGVRASFQGGNLAAWLTRVATHAAIDHVRRQRREVPSSGEAILSDEPDARDLRHAEAARVDEKLEAKLLIDRFRREQLPEEWAPVFEARFLRQLPQRDAARELGMHRTTLAYREQRIRALLKRFLLDLETSRENRDHGSNGDGDAHDAL